MLLDSKQYFFISHMISPIDLFHPPPAPHFKTSQVFLIYRPKHTIHIHTNNTEVTNQTIGNEVADTLAKEATQDEEDRNFIYDRIPISTVASSVKEEWLKNGKRNGKGQRKERNADLFLQL